MFPLKVLKLFRKTFGSWPTATPPRRKPHRTFRPRLEGLEDRIVPAYDVWIAPASNQAQSWDVGSNWVLQRKPIAGDTVVFAQPGLGAGSNTPCFIPAGDNVPTLGQLNVGAWEGTLTLNSNLAADSVGIALRKGAGGSNDIIINSGSHLYALQSLTWNGGSVTGSGTFEVGGNASSDTINGLDATDMPTLGCTMNVGTSYLGTNYAGNVNFATSSQPLVVNSNANIYINANSSLTFSNDSGNGTSVTAISNGDTAVHSNIVNGGTLSRTNLCELLVCTGLDVESGRVNVSNPQGQISGNPLHFTRFNSNGSGLLVSGGTVNLQGGFTSDGYGLFNGGSTGVGSDQQTNTLTLGVNANSTASYMAGGLFILQNILVPHGGFVLGGGNFDTDGSLSALVILDTGNAFQMDGGELDITQGGSGGGAVAVGILKINGNFTGNYGTIVDTVNSQTGTYGSFQVTGNATLNPDAQFDSFDLNQPGPNYHKNRVLMNVGGELSGDFTYLLPSGWQHQWSNGELNITENT